MFVLKKYFDMLKIKVENLGSFGNLISNRLSQIEDSLSDLKRNLFKNDFHGYMRPKVDLLDDKVSEYQTEMWNALDGLKKRMEKLEK